MAFGSEVGSGHISIFPTMKGFRSAVNKEVQGAGKEGASQFSNAFDGGKIGRTFGSGFKTAFKGSSTGMADDVLKPFKVDLAQATSKASAALLNYRQSTVSVKAAQERLNDAVAKYGSDSAQAQAAAIKVEQAQLRQATALDKSNSAAEAKTNAARALKAAEEELATASAHVQTQQSQQAGVMNRLRGAFQNVTASVGSFGAESSKSVEAASGGWMKLGGIIGVASSITQNAIGVISSSLSSAINRADQMNNFPKVMRNLGYSSEEAAASIKKISASLDGLPTTSSTMTGMVQQLAPLTSNLDEATDIALAFNNAMLAGGASTVEQENALAQYTQMLSAGTVDMEAWRSIQAAMPGQLNQVAEAMMGAGHNANDLYDAMKDGTYTFDDFNKAVVELNRKGLGKYASFAQQAKDATQGIGTAVENVKNRVAKAVQKVVEAFGVENIAGAINQFSSQFGKIGDAAASMVTTAKGKLKNLYEELEQTGAIDRFKDAVGTAFDEAKRRVGDAAKSIWESWQKLIPPDDLKNIIGDVLDYLGRVIGNLADTVSDTVEWFARFFKALADNGAVQALAGALKDLFDAIGDIADAFMGAKDAAGQASGEFDTAKASADLLGGVVKVVADLIETMAKHLKNTADWVQKFTDKLNDSGALKTWGDALKKIFDAIGDVLDSLGRLSDALDGNKKSTDDAGGSLDSAAKSAELFAKYIGFVADVVGGVADVFQGIADAIGKVSDGIDWLNEKLPWLGELFKMLGDPVTVVKNALGEMFAFLNSDQGSAALEFFDGTFLQPLKTKLDELGQWFKDLPQNISDFFQDLPQKISDAGSQLLDGIEEWFSQLPQRIGYWLGFALGTVVSWGANLVANGIESATRFVEDIGRWLQELPGNVSRWLDQTIQNVRAWAGQMGDNARNAGTQFLNGVVQFLQELPGRVMQFLNDVINRARAWAGQMGSEARNAGSQFIDNITGILQSLPGRIQAMFTGAGQWLVNSGRSIMSGLAQGIRDGIGDAVQSASDAMARISNLFPHSPAKEGPFSGRGWTPYSGRAIINGLAEGMTAATPAAVGRIRNAMQELHDTLNGQPATYTAMALTTNGTTTNGTTTTGQPANDTTAEQLGETIYTAVVRALAGLPRLQVYSTARQLAWAIAPEVDSALASRRERGIQ